MNYYRLGAVYPRTRLRESYPTQPRRLTWLILEISALDSLVTTIFGSGVRLYHTHGNSTALLLTAGDDSRSSNTHGDGTATADTVGSDSRLSTVKGF